MSTESIETNIVKQCKIENLKPSDNFQISFQETYIKTL